MSTTARKRHHSSRTNNSGPNRSTPSANLDSDDGQVDGAIRRRSRRRQEFDALHQEMELVEHGVAKSGHARRVLPRRQSKVRTMKRKLLERQEAEAEVTNATGIHQKDSSNHTNRPRGGKAAIDDSVIQASLIFGGGTKKQTTEASEKALSKCDADEDPSTGDENDTSDDGDENDIEEDETGDAEINEEDDLDEASVEDDPETTELELSLPTPSPRSDSNGKKSKRSNSGNPRRKNRRPVQKRLRNFRSCKMAERHGAALGAHVSGKPALAIRRLKQVAASAPAAPQVYSSLGMVYEDMLLQSQRQQDQSEFEYLDAIAQDKILSEQLSLAKKAYGSYHVAAIFCKRDYSLWLRAADSAFEIAGLHTTTMRLPGIAREVVEFHRAEKQRWLEEAKHDYQTAYNLNPPGIDTPAKLAFTMMELGHLSEALALLTHVKSHKDFVGSFRAWVLYADLMLRIGYECNQWNKGIQTNGNHMFRRWLRKLAATFDWQERRLQALAMGLLAAAGSQHCQCFTTWLKQHVDAIGELGSDAMDDATEMDEEKGRTENACEVDVPTPVAPSEISNINDLESERDRLLRANQVELDAFDKVTETMKLTVNSFDAQQRSIARSNLIKKHKSALVQLVGEYHQKRSTRDQSLPYHDENSEARPGRKSDGKHSLTASCRTVFSIASELLRHMISMQLYDGGRLAGDSVSFYLKERAILRENRLKARQGFDESQQRSVDVFAMQHETYDEPDHSSVEDEGGSLPLSDDEELDNVEDEDLVRALKSGTLPPELLYLYGLCLAGEGGKVFLADACMQALGELPLESRTWIEESVADTGVAPDSMWVLFQEERTRPLRRVAALVLAVDVFKQTGYNRGLTARVAPLFRKCIVNLKQASIFDALFSSKSQSDVVCRQRKNQIVKILVAETRSQVDEAELRYAQGCKGVLTALVAAVNSLTEVLPIVWSVKKGSINATCCDIVDSTACILNFIARQVQDFAINRDQLMMEELTRGITRLISVLYNSPSLTLADDVLRSTGAFAVPPLSASSWLSPDLGVLALQSFNLCAGFNITLFSGWEPEKFSLRLLRGTTFNYFGVSVENSVFAGYLTPSHERELLEQWEMVTALAPSLVFDYGEKFRRLQETSWYKISRERYMTTQAKHRIAIYEEDRGISAILSFSRFCLKVAGHAHRRDKTLYVALSILLPITQFCLNEALWDADIGRQDGSASSRLWQDFSLVHKPSPSPSCRPGYIRPCKKALAVASGDDSERALHEWFSFEDGLDPLSNLISIPLQHLLETWRKYHDSGNRSESTSESGTDLMKDVDLCMSKLRSSYTIPSVERASLHLSASLIRLASCPECYDPFACLQEAVMFASMSSKGGTCDQLFQARLPQLEACGPLDALLILGRAECLNALHFCQEAAFLCSYVASACGNHRHEDDSSFQSDERWTIIGIMTYDLSVMIKNLAGVLLREFDRREDTYGTWSVAVIQELLHARTNGVTWKEQCLGITINSETLATFHGTKAVHPEDASKRTSRIQEWPDVHNLPATSTVVDGPSDELQFESLSVSGFVAV
jgi:hypothetical protein